MCLLSLDKGSDGIRADPCTFSRSVLGEAYDVTPMVVPARAWLEEVRKFMRGDYYIGRGSTQRGLTQSQICNDYKVSVYGRKEAIWRCERKLRTHPVLRESLWTMSGLRLVCHCKRTQERHGDAIIQQFRQHFPNAYDREASASAPPSSCVLNYLSRLREEPESEGETSPDEGAPPKGSGWRGKGPPLMVGVGCTAREYCDGQSLASPGRWAVRQRQYPDTAQWKAVSSIFMEYAERHGSTEVADEAGSWSS